MIYKQHRIQQPVENIDIHCHARNKDNPCIVSIDTQDFQPGQSIGSFYSLGLHPWFIERQDVEYAIEKIVLSMNDPKLLAIGECGLDKRRPDGIYNLVRNVCKIGNGFKGLLGLGVKTLRKALNPVFQK